MRSRLICLEKKVKKTCFEGNEKTGIKEILEMNRRQWKQDCQSEHDSQVLVVANVRLIIFYYGECKFSKLLYFSFIGSRICRMNYLNAKKKKNLDFHSNEQPSACGDMKCMDEKTSSYGLKYET